MMPIPEQIAGQTDGIAMGPGPASQGAKRLWNREHSLWEEAQRYRLVRPLPPGFGWEGPSGGAFGKYYSPEPGWKFTEGIDLARPGAFAAPAGPDFTGPLGEGINISNERVFSSFWGTPERLVCSIGKTDVYNRAAMNWTSSMKPVGQIVLRADDFAGAAQPEVSTSVHAGMPIRLANCRTRKADTTASASGFGKRSLPRRRSRRVSIITWSQESVGQPPRCRPRRCRRGWVRQCLFEMTRRPAPPPPPRARQNRNSTSSSMQRW